MIDDVLLNLSNNAYRIIPTDDLIEGIKDLAGNDAIYVSYNI